jgi:uncharacterized membrane protein
MKKIVFLLVSTISLAVASFAQSTTPRGGSTTANNDNTGRAIVQSFQSKAYAATIAIRPNASITTVVVAQLTGAATITVSNTRSYAGDILRIVFSADASIRVVTFGSGFQSAGTLSVAATKYGAATFIFNGTTWVEISRAATAMLIMENLLDRIPVQPAEAFMPEGYQRCNTA